MGRPLRRMPAAVKARKLIEDLARSAEEAPPRRLTEQEAKDAIALSEDEVKVLNLIAAGRPPRNAMAILGAIRLKLEHTVKKAKQEVGVDGELAVTVTTIGDEP